MFRSTAPDSSSVPLHALLHLGGRTAVVTGGARGIGYAIAERLAEAGATVVISDVDEEAVTRAAETVSGRYDADVRPAVTDVTDPSAVEALARFADSLGDGMNIWINNAGIYPSAPVTDVHDDEWRRAMSITLDGTFHGCREAARCMTGRPELPGRVIINMSSLSGLRGRRNLSTYVAAKHGVTGLVRALAVELGPSGIRVVGVAPSVVDTPGMRARSDAASSEERERLRALESTARAAIPLGRIGVPDDVALATLFLASDMAQFISGVVIPVDGGTSAS